MAKRAKELDDRNAELARRAVVDGHTRPDVVKHAMKSNDPRLLGLSSEELYNEHYIDTVRKITADSLGTDVANSDEYRAALAESTNPRKTTQEFLNEQLKGLDDFSAAAFTERFSALTEPLVRDANNRLVGQNLQTQLTTEQTAWRNERFKTPQAWTVHMGNLRTLAAQGGGAAVDAVTKAEEYSVLDAAARGEQWAVRLASESSMMTDNGLTLKQVHKDYWEDEAKPKAIKSLPAVNNPEQTRLHQNFDLALAEGRIKDAAGLLAQDRRLHESGRGAPSGAHVKRVAALNKAMDTQLTVGSVAQTKKDGHSPLVHDTKDLNKVIRTIQRNPGAWISEFASPEEANMHLADLYESMGSTLSSENKNMLMNQLMRDDEQTANHVWGTISMLGDGAANLMPDGYSWLPGMIARHGLKNTRDKFPEMQANRPSFTPGTAISDGLGLSGDDRTTFVDEAYGKALDRIEPNLLGIDDIDPEDIAQSSPAARLDFEKILGETIFDMHMSGATNEEIVGEAARRFGLSHGPGRNRDGDIVVTRVGAQGQGQVEGSTVKTRPVTRSELDFEVESLENDWAGLVTYGRGSREAPRVHGGSPEELAAVLEAQTDQTLGIEFNGTLMPDPTMKANTGLVPEFDFPNGTSGRFAVVQGLAMPFPPGAANAPLFKGWTRVEGPEREDGAIWMLPPTQDTMIDGSRAWNVSNGTVTLTVPGRALNLRAGDAMEETNERGHIIVQDGRLPSDDGRGLAEHSKRMAGRKMLNEFLPDHLDADIMEDASGQTPTTPEEISAVMADAIEKNDATGRFFANIMAPQYTDERAVLWKFIDNVEGNIPFAYDDSIGGRRFRDGDKKVGARTIGMGYNMDRGDWGRVSERLGIDKDRAKRLYDQEVDPTATELEQLNALVLREGAAEVYDLYGGKGIERPFNFYIARTSLYHNGVRDTPKMDRAWDEGNWAEVAMEVMYRSEKGIRKNQLAAIRSRRKKEARLMLGNRVHDIPLSVTDPDTGMPLRDVLLRTDPWS